MIVFFHSKFKRKLNNPLIAITINDQFSPISQLRFTYSKSTIVTLKIGYEICSKLIIKTLERLQWRRSFVFIVKACVRCFLKT